VHVHSPWAVGQAALREARKHDIPTVFTVHLTRPNAVNHTFLAGLAPELTWSTVRRAYTTCGEHSDYITAPSFIGREHALSLFGLRSIGVVSNGVTPLPHRAQVRSADGRIRLLYVGRLSKEKNVETLIRAVASPELRDRVRLEIVGCGTQMRRLQRLAGRTQVPVSFAGSLSDRELSDRYAAADIFCMPSRAELECIAALEAMSFELPITAPRGSALDETGGAVWLYEDAYSERQLADALTTLITEPRHVLTLQERARRVAQSRSLETIAARWTDIYSQLHAGREGSHLAVAFAGRSSESVPAKA
jgi:glycosyltransferase involved in cell wall biosynthesis